jgi:hypothetical protein
VSSLRKQEIRSKKRKRNDTKSSSKLGSPALSFLIMLARLPVVSIRWALKIARRSPRASLIAAATLSAMLLLAWGLQAFHKMESNSLPKSFRIFSSSDALTERINRTAWQTLQEARRLKSTRTEFMQELSRSLTMLEDMDDFEVRTGLDKTLQITAVPQTPAFVVEVEDGTRWAVSQRLSVIGQAPSNFSEANLLLVKFPELKIVQKLDFAKHEKSHRFQLAGINMPWVFRQVRLFSSQNELFSAHKMQLESLSWRAATGLSAKFLRKSDTSNPSLPALVAVFGDSEINQRLDKLRDLLKDFSSRNLTPEQVDLSFSDRALIRMRLSEGPVPVTF